MYFYRIIFFFYWFIYNIFLKLYTQKKIVNNIYNYFGIEMFYPLLDLIYEKYKIRNYISYIFLLFILIKLLECPDNSKSNSI